MIKYIGETSRLVNNHQNINLTHIYIMAHLTYVFFLFPASTDSPGLCAFILTIISYLLIIATFPFSLCLCVKVRTGPESGS